MGVCFCGQVKVESSYHSGSIDKFESADASETDSISKSSKASLSFPATPVLGSEGKMLEALDLKSFTFSDLKRATRNFRPENVLGEGGCGSVFKGWIDEQTLAASKPGTGTIVAVKRMKNGSLYGYTEWLAEINFLGLLNHPNLVKLVGYCVEDDQRLLVNEFMARGSLENHLFRRGSYFQPLSWNLRVKVALGAAKGLAYLHSPEINIVHRDFSTSSILLDLNYNAKLSDIGLPKEKDDSSDDARSLTVRYSSRIIPLTCGYDAPEYNTAGNLTTKSNVYSFGIVLLEMLSGRRVVDRNRPRNETHLVEWATPYLPKKVFRILDNRLEGQYKNDAAQKVATLALLCLSNVPKCRPTMEQVVEVLEKLQDPNETSPAQSKPTRRRSTGTYMSAQAKSLIATTSS